MILVVRILVRVYIVCIFRGFVYLFVNLLFAGIYFVYPGSFGEFVLLYATFIFVSGYLLLRNKINFFEPFYLFSAYYVTLIFSAMALRFGGFENNMFLAGTFFYSDVDSVYFRCVLYSFLGYLFAFVGYKLCATSEIVSINAVAAHKNRSVLRFFAYILFFIGLANFSYNVMTLYSGDIIEYYKNISMRAYDFQNGGTTLGYHLIYIAVYIFFLLDLDRKKIAIKTIVFALAAVAVFASQGRIFQTLTFVMSFVVLYYYSMGAVRLNARVLLVGVFIVISGLVFYLLRYASSLNYNQGLDDGLAYFLMSSLTVDTLLEMSVGMGNLPNFAVLMKVVDSWSRDIGYMWGLTLLYPLADFMPSVFDEAVGMPAALAKNQWYGHIAGGTLPVTGIGEMYLNFGIFGPVLGMFLFGCLGAAIYNFAVRRGGSIFLIFYAKFAIGFFMLYPKGEFNNFGFLWMAIHPFLIFVLIKFLDRLQGAFASRSVVN